jgi:GT2 family glycosyltransferase
VRSARAARSSPARATVPRNRNDYASVHAMRPPIDVVVPFVGGDEALRSLCQGLEGLDLTDADSVTVVDNRPDENATETTSGRVRVIPAPAIQSSYYARNCGARDGTAPWILFVDADVRLSGDLLERYFDESPADRTGVLAGAIGNEPLVSGGSQTLAARYSALKGLFAQERTLDRGELGYAMTANCAIRRSAFTEVGGFVETIRSGGDADICFRIRAKGWGIEPRDRAVVTHVNRDTLSQLVRQSVRHGSGAAWLETMYPRFSQAGDVPGRATRTSRRLTRATAQMAKGNLDDALVVTIDIVRRLAFQAGRHISNQATTSASHR